MEHRNVNSAKGQTSRLRYPSIKFLYGASINKFKGSDYTALSDHFWQVESGLAIFKGKKSLPATLAKNC